jgi:hypothetical protein
MLSRKFCAAILFPFQRFCYICPHLLFDRGSPIPNDVCFYGMLSGLYILLLLCKICEFKAFTLHYCSYSQEKHEHVQTQGQMPMSEGPWSRDLVRRLAVTEEL